MRRIHLTQEEKENLHKKHKEQKEKDKADKIKAILLRAENYSNIEIGEFLPG